MDKIVFEKFNDSGFVSVIGKSRTSRPASELSQPQGVTGVKFCPPGEVTTIQTVTVEQPHVTPGSAKEGRLVELLKKVRDDVSSYALQTKPEILCDEAIYLLSQICYNEWQRSYFIHQMTKKKCRKVNAINEKYLTVMEHDERL